MVTFVLAAILILIATLAFLIWPLLFTRNTFSYARHAQNIHYAKERLTELELQLKNASISATDYEALKLEIETTLAQDIDLAKAQESENAPLPRRPNKASITALCLFLPLGSAAIYTYVGTPEALNPTRLMATANQSLNDAPSAQEINDMVAALEQRLIDKPDDAQGWALLSRTYLATGQYAKATVGLKKVIELNGESSEIYASLADATALAAEGNMAGEPTEYADKALLLNPLNPQALWLRGLAAVQKGDNATAKLHWNTLLGVLADQPEQQSELKTIMAESLGVDAITYTAQAETQQASSAGQNSDSPASNTQNTESISVLINIDPSIAAQLEPNDFVFVFARAKNGPPAPLAAKRLQVSDLPIELKLNDIDAMMPQLKMSLFEELSVSARVSKSGQPIAQSGDYQSKTVEAKTGQRELITLTINTLIE